MTQEEAINKLVECLIEGNVMLFTGAGFSLEAVNGDNQPLPSGDKLKRMILSDVLELKKESNEYKSLYQEKLPDVITYAEDEKGKSSVQDYLTHLFKECQPKDFHKIIAAFPWKRVYTTNIDDVFENAAPKGKYSVQNMRRLQKNNYGAEKIDYFKLHGCVRNPSAGYVFSSEDYDEETAVKDHSGLHSYSLDIQTNNFVFIGFDDNEYDINSYLKTYNWRTDAKPNSKLFFVNPSPTLIFQNKVKKQKGIIIEINTNQFASIIENKLKKGVTPTKNSKTFISGFSCVNSEIEKCFNISCKQSRLLYGDFPTWNDICFQWDFKHPLINILVKKILDLNAKDNDSIVLSLYGRMLNGKSVFLKRIGYELVQEDFVVYEIAKRDFSLETFLDKCSRSSLKKIALLVDNAPFFYPSIERLISRFPKDKKLIVVTVGRTYFHKKQRYAFQHLSYFYEFLIDPFTKEFRTDYAKEIVSKLYEKGLLGYLQNKEQSAQIKEVLRYDDICGLLYSLTDSFSFKSKFLTNYKKELSINHNLRECRSVLLALAIFQELDIPSFPLEILAIWKCHSYKHTLNVIRDYIRFIDEDSIALRNGFITKEILNQADVNVKMNTLSKILRLIAPQRPAYGRNMWSMMQEKLMGYRTLRKTFGLPQSLVRKLYDTILPNYNTDYNYWIQVGIADQEEKDYMSAHNHLTQAENLNNVSYLVRHALARNYLLRAIDDKESSAASENYYKGKTNMLRLIIDREGDQTKAYSIHSYVTYSVKYWRKFAIQPTKSEVVQMQSLLKSLNTNGQNDAKTAHAEQQLFKYLKENNIKTSRTYNWNELNLLKQTLANEGVNYEDFIEDEFPE